MNRGVVRRLHLKMFGEKSMDNLASNDSNVVKSDHAGYVLFSLEVSFSFVPDARIFENLLAVVPILGTP
ncbi:MAG: hypothetical protein QG629_176 [Patescibacteria group bacterium]|nr:hypothetical protein [Patescibacteria group bacterium]